MDPSFESASSVAFANARAAELLISLAQPTAPVEDIPSQEDDQEAEASTFSSSPNTNDASTTTTSVITATSTVAVAAAAAVATPGDADADKDGKATKQVSKKVSKKARKTRSSTRIATAATDSQNREHKISQALLPVALRSHLKESKYWALETPALSDVDDNGVQRRRRRSAMRSATVVTGSTTNNERNSASSLLSPLPNRTLNTPGTIRETPVASTLDESPFENATIPALSSFSTRRSKRNDRQLKKRKITKTAVTTRTTAVAAASPSAPSSRGVGPLVPPPPPADVEGEPAATTATRRSVRKCARRPIKYYNNNNDGLSVSNDVIDVYEDEVDDDESTSRCDNTTSFTNTRKRSSGAQASNMGTVSKNCRQTTITAPRTVPMNRGIDDDSEAPRRSTRLRRDTNNNNNNDDAASGGVHGDDDETVADNGTAAAGIVRDDDNGTDADNNDTASAGFVPQADDNDNVTAAATTSQRRSSSRIGTSSTTTAQQSASASSTAATATATTTTTPFGLASRRGARRAASSRTMAERLSSSSLTATTTMTTASVEDIIKRIIADNKRIFKEIRATVKAMDKKDLPAIPSNYDNIKDNVITCWENRGKWDLKFYDRRYLYHKRFNPHPSLHIGKYDDKMTALRYALHIKHLALDEMQMLDEDKDTRGGQCRLIPVLEENVRPTYMNKNGKVTDMDPMTGTRLPFGIILDWDKRNIGNGSQRWFPRALKFEEWRAVEGNPSDNTTESSLQYHQFRRDLEFKSYKQARSAFRKKVLNSMDFVDYMVESTEQNKKPICRGPKRKNGSKECPKLTYHTELFAEAKQDDQRNNSCIHNYHRYRFVTSTLHCDHNTKRMESLKEEDKMKFIVASDLKKYAFNKKRLDSQCLELRCHGCHILVSLEDDNSSIRFNSVWRRHKLNKFQEQNYECFGPKPFDVGKSPCPHQTNLTNRWNAACGNLEEEELFCVYELIFDHRTSRMEDVNGVRLSSIDQQIRMTLRNVTRNDIRLMENDLGNIRCYSCNHEATRHLVRKHQRTKTDHLRFYDYYDFMSVCHGFPCDYERPYNVVNYALEAGYCTGTCIMIKLRIVETDEDEWCPATVQEYENRTVTYLDDKINCFAVHRILYDGDPTGLRDIVFKSNNRLSYAEIDFDPESRTYKELEWHDVEYKLVERRN